jgi:hypothetical protein
MSAEDVVASFNSSVKLDMEEGNRQSESTRSRQTWFVAIAGFAILNSRQLWEAILTRELRPGEFVLMAIPWLVAAVAAVWTHYLGGLHDIARHKFFLNKIAELDLLYGATKERRPNPVMWKAVINDDTEALRPLRKEADSYVARVNRSERIALGGIAAGFVWTIAIPLILTICG